MVLSRMCSPTVAGLALIKAHMTSTPQPHLEVQQLGAGENLEEALQRQWPTAWHRLQLPVRGVVAAQGGLPVLAELRQRCDLPARQGGAQ